MSTSGSDNGIAHKNSNTPSTTAATISTSARLPVASARAVSSGAPMIAPNMFTVMNMNRPPSASGCTVAKNGRTAGMSSVDDSIDKNTNAAAANGASGAAAAAAGRRRRRERGIATICALDAKKKEPAEAGSFRGEAEASAQLSGAQMAFDTLSLSSTH